MITYTCDGEYHPILQHFPAADHKPGETLEIRGAKIPLPSHTYTVVGWMNEHQLAIGETTFGGRKELHNPRGALVYEDLMRLALLQAKTARQAIRVMTSAAETYGYRSTGETFSIADPKEVWIMELIGTGPKSKKVVWVARKIPDGCICAHANKARIGTFPLHDPENCIYSPDVIRFAVKKGYYDPKSGEPFRFNEAYCPSTPQNQRYGSMRVWSVFRRAAPSLSLSPAYHRAEKGAKPYPLWIKPDKKLALADVFALMRDHYEGTRFDMTKGVDAGPFGMPDRWRPLSWKVDGREYAWERPISTQQTAYTFVSQSRSWLPDYCAIARPPRSFAVGSLNRFSWDSAWWVFNFVANFTNLRYRDMVKDVQALQKDLEGTFLALQPAVEKTACELCRKNPKLMTRYLTDYSVTHAEMTVRKWRELAELLIRKYNDGYIQDENGRPRNAGYPQEWLKLVVKNRSRIGLNNSGSPRRKKRLPRRNQQSSGSAREKEVVFPRKRESWADRDPCCRGWASRDGGVGKG